MNGFHVSEEAEISGKLLRNMRKGLSMWKMTQICGKWLKYMEKCLDMW